MAAQHQEGRQGRRHHRPGQGPHRRGDQGHAEGKPRAGARRQHGDAPSEADGGGAGRPRAQGSADPPVEHRDRRSDRRQADARRLQDRWRTAARCVSPSARERRSMAEAKASKPAKAKAAEPRRARARARGYEPRLQKYYREVVVPKLNEQFGYKNPHCGAAHRQDRAQHGRRRGGRRHQEGAARRRTTWR